MNVPVHRYLAALLLPLLLGASALAQVPADSIGAAVAERLARLEAENDSLRAEVEALRGALLAAPAVEESGTDGTDKPLGEAGETLQYVGLRFFWALVALVVTAFVVRAATALLELLAARSASRRLFFKKLIPIARIVLWTLAFYVILRGIFALDAAGLAAAAAAAGVAIGFAAQDVLKNIFGGLVIIFDQPFQVGDKVSVGDTYGEVVTIGLRSTRIVTPDDNLVSVPNSQIVDSQVANANAGVLDCQVVTDLWLPPTVDEALAKRVAYEAAASSKYVYLEKPIVVLVSDQFNETVMTRLRVKAYVLDHKYEFPLQSEITERARAEFRRRGLLGSPPEVPASNGTASPGP